ncbi:hypothetical protein KILIM_032_00170 [Kineosphaera limosa NBRC 100340]|uniref:Uncharacterized protein n=1 Tax=Kineosphaera limosa NBRC 100340 TaxID=1184609 RepID=K6WVJ6_9MICO|nr:hypothetical protein KILIM_032_00170 [Kineosphaera limosa NBRC 100340]
MDPGVDEDVDQRECADVVDIGALLDLGGYAAGMRVLGRRQRPLGVEQRFDDVQDYRLTAFATSANRRTWNCGTGAGPAANTGSSIAKTPDEPAVGGHAVNRIWISIAQLAADVQAWHAPTVPCPVTRLPAGNQNASDAAVSAPGPGHAAATVQHPRAPWPAQNGPLGQPDRRRLPTPGRRARRPG